MDDPRFELTDEQKEKILNEWNSRLTNPPSIAELVVLAWGPNVDTHGNNKYSRSIKSFLASRKTKNGAPEETKSQLELTEEQKEYIRNNYQTLKIFEIARILFNNNLLGVGNAETKAVTSYVRSLNTTEAYQDPQEVPQEDWRPPTTLDRISARINKYVRGDNYNFKELNPRQKKNAYSLINYLHTYRLVHLINTLESQVDRELFESAFISYTYDKPDLSKEDVDQYIILCLEVVQSSNIQKTIKMFQEEQNREVEEKGKLSMALVEAIGVARKEYNECVARQQRLFKALTEERSKRLSNQIKDNATILNVIVDWKQEESRKKTIKAAEMRKLKYKQGVQEIETMDEYKARVLGFSVEEALDG